MMRLCPESGSTGSELSAFGQSGLVRLSCVIMSEVTRLLNAVRDGDKNAASGLLPLVYEELRQLARQRMRQERGEHTLQATALVHEAYLRLVQDEPCGWDGRGHFFAAAAE